MNTRFTDFCLADRGRGWNGLCLHWTDWSQESVRQVCGWLYILSFSRIPPSAPVFPGVLCLF